MKKLNIKKSIEINTNVAKTWNIIGPNFINIADWARGVDKSWKNDSAPKVFDSAPTGGRYCDVKGFGKFDEQITHYAEQKHEISWTAKGEKLPKFLSGLKNELSIEELDENNCRVNSHISANLSGIGGFLMRSMMKANFTKTISGFLKDWKVYAETGKASDFKQAELDKL